MVAPGLEVLTEKLEDLSDSLLDSSRLSWFGNGRVLVELGSGSSIAVAIYLTITFLGWLGSHATKA